MKIICITITESLQSSQLKGPIIIKKVTLPSVDVSLMLSAHVEQKDDFYKVGNEYELIIQECKEAK